MSSPWQMLAEADACLLRYLAKSGSVDDDLIKALVLIREVTKGFEVIVAEAELAEYQPDLH